MFKLKSALATAVVLATTVGAHASTITPAAGLDLTRGTTESSMVQVFSEGTSVAVGENAVTVDFLVGSNINVGDTDTGINSFSSGLDLTAGVYDSFLVHYDPLTAASVNDFTFDFGATIVAIIVSNAGSQSLLELSDSVFGDATTTYDNHIGRRTESHDDFTLVDASTMTFSFSTSSTHIDNIRVITMADITPVPVPASLPLLLAGLGGFAALRRRKS